MSIIEKAASRIDQSTRQQRRPSVAGQPGAVAGRHAGAVAAIVAGSRPYSRSRHPQPR